MLGQPRHPQKFPAIRYIVYVYELIMLLALICTLGNMLKRFQLEVICKAFYYLSVTGVLYIHVFMYGIHIGNTDTDNMYSACYSTGCDTHAHHQCVQPLTIGHVLPSTQGHQLLLHGPEERLVLPNKINWK